MSGQYVPQVGDRVRRPSWPPNETAEVIGADGDDLWLRNNQAQAYCSIVDDNWIKVEPVVPLPESWINIYRNSTFGAIHRDFAACVAVADTYDGAIARIHIWTDADGVDHIERVPS